MIGARMRVDVSRIVCKKHGMPVNECEYCDEDERIANES